MVCYISDAMALALASAATKTNILFFERRALNRDATLRTRVAVAMACGHDRRGRVTKTSGEPFPDDFALIAEDWNNPNPSWWTDAEITNPNYLVPRYYDRHSNDEVNEDAERLSTDTIQLQALVEAGLISIRKGHEVGADAYGSGDIPFVRTSDIANFEISIDPTNSVSDFVYKKYSGISADLGRYAGRNGVQVSQIGILLAAPDVVSLFVAAPGNQVIVTRSRPYRAFADVHRILSTPSSSSLGLQCKRSLGGLVPN
jgi:hypothetical protein